MKVYIFYIIVSLLFFSCSSEEKNVPIEIGSITGTVNLFTSRGGYAPNDSMQVSLQGTSPLITTLTNQNGNYRFDNISYGRYDLRFEKEGFGTFKRGDIIHQDEETFLETFETLGKNQLPRFNNCNFLKQIRVLHYQ